MKHARLFSVVSFIVLSGASLSACMSPAALAAPVVSGEAWISASQQRAAQGLTETGYTAAWNELKLDPELGAESATISGTSYVLDCQCDRSQRPVMFLFNGGPGASSSPLHFALGPYSRERADNAETIFPENAHTILAETDLVFIDPVDTGFSRSNSESGQERYLGVEGDVEAVNLFVSEWLKRHERQSSPVFFTGQSYGGFRLANLVAQIDDIDVRGLIMVSPMLEAGAGGTDIAYVFSLPTMTATAWRYGKSDISAVDEADAWEQGRAFAETEYLLGLQQGARLDEATKHALAAKVAALTGLEEQAVIEMNLRVGIQNFLENVLAEEGLLVSRLNTDVTSPKPPSDQNAHRPAAANDPSLGLGRSNVILSSDIAQYLQDTTGLDRGNDYRSLNLDANFLWDWRASAKTPDFYVNAVTPLSKFLRKNEETRLLVFAGYRDLATTLLSNKYSLSHNDLPQDRVNLIAMAGGHSPYDETNLKEEFSGHIRAFIADALADRGTDAEGTPK